MVSSLLGGSERHRKASQTSLVEPALKVFYRSVELKGFPDGRTTIISIKKEKSKDKGKTFAC